MRVRNIWTTIIPFILVSIVSSEAAAAAVSSADAPHIWALAPPVLAIIMAVFFRQVLPALFGGVWLGVWLIGGATLGGVATSFLGTFSTYVIGAIADPDHASILSFTFMIGGMIGIITRNGGLDGVVALLSKWASNSRRVQLATSGLGLSIFFDDYANIMLIGNTMRPLTDRMKVSREKLAYLCDSTSAPIATIAIISTWVGYQVSLIGAATEGIAGVEAPYLIFINSIAYSFYPILTIIFVFMIAATGRDFGPMLKAEQKAFKRPSEPLEPITSPAQKPYKIAAPEDEPGEPPRAINAILPIFALIAGVIGGLFVTGKGDTLADIIGSANAFTALNWGSLIGVTVAILLTLAQRLASLDDVVAAWVAGAERMFMPLVILVLAWSIAAVTKELGAANYLVSLLSEDTPAAIIPAAVFLIAFATAFATGTSWGVMAILMPLAIPLVLSLITVGGVIDPTQMTILYSTIACVLAGAVWGDHCSPIADTTIMSSMAAGCDHIDHVRTQAPYAILVGVVALVTGVVPSALGVPWWVCVPAGAIVLSLILRTFGKSSDA